MTAFKTITLTSFLIFWLLFTKADGQIASNYNFKFKNYTTQNGLVHNFTKKCRKDSKGFLWIITQNGLSRFDGVNFKNFQNSIGDNTSLPYNDIADIAIDKNDNIWLAYTKGLCIYNTKKQIFEVIKAKFSTQAISLVYDEKKELIWYNTNTGLFNINTNNFQVNATSQQINYHQRPYSTCLDHKGQVWSAIEREGYYVYNTSTNTYSYYSPNTWPRNFDEDNDGNMWMSTWQGGLQLLHNYNGSDKEVFDIFYKNKYDSSIIQNITQSYTLTGKDILWVLTHTDGIALFDKKEKKFVKQIKYDPTTKSGLLSNFSTSIYADKDGIVWVCSWRGLSKINKQEQQFQSAELPMLETTYYNLLAGIIDDPYNNNICWLAVHGSGIVKYDKIENKIIERYFFNSSTTKADDVYNWRWVNSIHADAKKRLWLASYGGAICIDKGKVNKIPAKWDIEKNVHFDGRILDDGNFWIFTKKGIAKLNTDTKQYTFYKNIKDTSQKEIAANRIYTALFINSSTLLCGTADGLYTLNITTNTSKKIPTALSDTLDGKWKKFMTLQKINDKVYCGTESGLVEYDLLSQKFTVKGKEQEIFKLEICSLTKDALNNLWIYTLHGLFRYDPLKNQFKKFTALDGIYDNSTDPVQMFTYNKNIYIGYRMAYTKFNPEEVDVNNNLVQPYITDIKINNQSQKIYIDSFSNATLNLHYQQNNLVFDYTGIDYTTSERISFAHKLEGFDKDWVYDGYKRTATYSNLSGDKYIFKVKSCNSSGIWNNKIAVFNFSIHPPFWQTWWFKILMALAFISTVILIAVERIKLIRKKEEEKTAVNKMLAELEMRALRSQMNPHFIFNSLNSIQKYIWDNKQEDASEYLTKFSKLIRIILNNSMHKLVTLEDELISLQLYLELEHRRCNNKFDYIINIDKAISPNSVLVPPMLMQPYIENAIWHGLLQKENRGKLSIDIHQLNKKTLICVIEDDGIGRKKAEIIKSRKDNKSVSFGMQITQQRLSVADVDGSIGHVKIDDLETNGEATGTRITLEIPIETFQKIG